MRDEERRGGELTRWYRAARRDLPWRCTSDPYRIWLSEVMLQQTRAETVKPYYARFLERFPTVEALASADERDVLKAWEGLGYYSRARNLQKAAQMVVSRYQGAFPGDYEGLRALPGVGEYTAGAVASIAFGRKTPAIDGNVKRVIARLYGIDQDVALPEAANAIRERVAALLLFADEAGELNQALMELGATVCAPRSPSCALCPWRDACAAHRDGVEEALPVHERRRKPKPVYVTVCLITAGGRVYVVNRSEKLLHHMNAFFLMEGEHEQTADEIRAGLDERGFHASKPPRYIGEAKHVFTHRIWYMKVYHVTCDKAEQAGFVGRDELAALPFPSALRYAKEQALRLLP